MEKNTINLKYSGFDPVLQCKTHDHKL